MLSWTTREESRRVMRGIATLDPEMDTESVEYWIARWRNGGLRRVVKTLAWMAVIGLAIAGFVVLVLRLAKLG
jgi:hypothetical protein